MGLGRGQHLEVDVRALVTGEADVAQLARLLRLQHRLQSPARREDAVRVLHADDLVELQQVDVIGLQPLQRLVELPRGALLAPAVDLGHQKGFLPVAVAQRLAHPDLALAVVVVPAVVEEVEALVESGADDPDALLLVGLLADVGAAQAHHGDFLAGAPQGAVGNSLRLGGPRDLAARTGDDSHRQGELQELPPGDAAGAAGFGGFRLFARSGHRFTSCRDRRIPAKRAPGPRGSPAGPRRSRDTGSQAPFPRWHVC